MTYACEIVHREGGGTTSRGQTELEALADAFAFVATRPRGTYVYVSDPYPIGPSRTWPGCMDTTPPPHVQAHRDAHMRRR